MQMHELKSAYRKIGRLKRSVLIKVESESDYTKIKKHIMNCESYKNDTINVDEIKVNHKGLITILCNSVEMTQPVIEEISKTGLSAYRPVIKKFLIRTHWFVLMASLRLLPMMQ